METDQPLIQLVRRGRYRRAGHVIQPASQESRHREPLRVAQRAVECLGAHPCEPFHHRRLVVAVDNSPLPAAVATIAERQYPRPHAVLPPEDRSLAATPPPAQGQLPSMAGNRTVAGRWDGDLASEMARRQVNEGAPGDETPGSDAGVWKVAALHEPIEGAAPQSEEGDCLADCHEAVLNQFFSMMPLVMCLRFMVDHHGLPPRDPSRSTATGRRRWTDALPRAIRSREQTTSTVRQPR